MGEMLALGNIIRKYGISFHADDTQKTVHIIS